MEIPVEHSRAAAGRLVVASDFPRRKPFLYGPFGRDGGGSGAGPPVPGLYRVAGTAIVGRAETVLASGARGIPRAHRAAERACRRSRRGGAVCPVRSRSSG